MKNLSIILLIAIIFSVYAFYDKNPQKVGLYGTASSYIAPVFKDTAAIDTTKHYTLYKKDTSGYKRNFVEIQ